MNFDLSDLRAFAAVAELGSFRAAAEAQHISQPALSRRVDKIEQALGFRLFERTTRKVELNAMGRVFLPRVRRVLDELDTAMFGMTDLANRLYGQVTVACIPSAVDNFLAAALQRFHQQYPSIHLRLLDQPATDILLSVVRVQADFGITYLGVQDPDLVFETLLREPFVLACRRDHPLAQERPLRWAQLAPYECVALAHGNGNRVLIDHGLAKQTAKPRWICEVQHVPTLLSLVKAGVGVGIVPKFALGRGDDAPLTAVPLIEPEIVRYVGIVRRAGSPLSAAAKAFYQTLRQFLPTTLG